MTARTMCLLLGTMVVAVTCDLSFPALNSLYNTRVKSAELVTRLKQGMPSWVPKMYPTTHSGVRVTLDDGNQFLIHKGPNFGRASDTVITDAAHMSDKWQVKKSLDLMGTNTVGDLMKAGGEHYGLLSANCHGAAKNIMNLLKDEE